MHKTCWYAAKTLFLIILFGASLFSPAYALGPLESAAIPAKPDYKTAGAWLAKPETPPLPVDVFYVYPTVLFNDTDWLMDPSRPEMKAAAGKPLHTQAAVFDGQANIYAPMYRQMNLAVLNLPDPDAATLEIYGYEDIWRAFQYYLKYENKGRPFFLAGHSQGAMVLTRIMLDHWGGTGAEDRLVAALLIGFSLTPADLKTNPAVAMCDSATRTGCVISYNTMAAGKQSAAPTRLPGALVVNPLSWTLDGSYVPAEKNIGAVFFTDEGHPALYPKFTSAQIIDSGLVVEPADITLVTPKGGKFPAGVYHAFDYSLFLKISGPILPSASRHSIPKRGLCAPQI